MKFAWCNKCHTDVSLAHAVAELPCPQCGGSSYFIMAEDYRRDELLSESERMMRLGRWTDAERALRDCFDGGYISEADFNLSLQNIEWRRQCARSAAVLVLAGAVPLDALKDKLTDDYDEHVVRWLLREYRGLRLVPDGGRYLVEGC